MDNLDGYTNPSKEQIEHILRQYKSVAVVGLSSDTTRPSNGVARYLQGKGYKIIPVNPNEKEVLGEKSYPDLSFIHDPVDIVDIFRKPEHVPVIVDQAIEVGAKVVWMQEGVVNHPAALKALKSGIIVVMDRCMAKEYRALCD
jgi:predicted CoA-binding protein